MKTTLPKKLQIDMDDDGDFDKNDSKLIYDVMEDYYMDCVLRGFGCSDKKETSSERASLSHSKDYTQVINKLHNAKQIDDYLKKHKKYLTKEQETDFKEAKKKFMSKQDSKGLHSKNGVYNKDRQKLHKKIIDSIVKIHNPRTEKNPVVIFLAGLPGSGKSTIVKSMNLKNYIVLDADEIKKRIPEFAKHSGISRAMITHNESSDIIQQLVTYSIHKKFNVLIDGTMKNYRKASKIITHANKKGYEVIVKATQLPTLKALDRNIKRFKSGGKDARYVPESIVLGAGKVYNQGLHKIKKHPGVSSYEIYDTDVEKGKNPKLIEKSKRKQKENLSSSQMCEMINS